MKKILNLAILPLLFLSIMSCSSDDSQTVADDHAAPVLISPEDGTTVVLTEGLENNVALTLVWNHGDYTVPTEINYTVELALAGTDFATPILAGSTTNRVLTLSVAELNGFAIQAGITPFEEGSLEVRVNSSIGANTEMPMVSNTLTFNVTPFEAIVIEEPKLYLVGAPQAYYGLAAWTPENGMPMRYIGNGTTKVFEAYVKVAAGDGFKFIGGLSWNEGNYGTIGGVQDGNIEDNGGSGDIKVAAEDGDGLYYVQVDIDNLTYKFVKMNWGIIGAATPSGWGAETPMNYDFATNKFMLTTDLTVENMKFRAKNAGDFIYANEWKFQIGNGDPMVAYDNGSGDIPVATAGSHDIEMSMDLQGTVTVTGL